MLVAGSAFGEHQSLGDSEFRLPDTGIRMSCFCGYAAAVGQYPFHTAANVLAGVGAVLLQCGIHYRICHLGVQQKNDPFHIVYDHCFLRRLFAGCGDHRMFYMYIFGETGEKISGRP